jgi:putative DNA primase/helicase
MNNLPSFYADLTKVLLAELNPINFRERIGLTNPKSEFKIKHYIIGVIHGILDKADDLQLGLCRYQGLIYGYNGTYWQGMERDDFIIFLGQAAKKLGVPSHIADYFEFSDNLEKQFNTTALLPTPQQRGDLTLINLVNGTLTIKDGEPLLKAHEASDFLTYKLGFDHDPNAEAPLFRKYLDEVVPDLDTQKCIAEYLGYVFIPGNRMKLEKVLVLYGKGGNGKSVLQEIVNALFGEVNICNFDLEMLTGSNGYYRAVFANKLLNVCSEISPRLKTAMFKQIASGEPVSARQIFGKPYTIRNYGKLFFNCNVLPTEVEATDGFFRRWLIAEFPNKFTDDKADINLHRKIIENELSGVLNWVLEGLTRLLKQGHFTESKIMKERIKKYQQETNNVAMFVEEQHYQPDDTTTVPQLDLFIHYKEYCSQNNYKAFNNRNFGDHLDSLGFNRTKRNIGKVVFIKKAEFEIENEEVVS